MRETRTQVLERQAKERNKQMDADVCAVLATPEGRRVLMSILHKGGVWKRTGCCDGDALRLAYTNGRRDATVDVLAACNRVAGAQVAAAMFENNTLIQKWNDQIENAKEEGEADL